MSFRKLFDNTTSADRILFLLLILLSFLGILFIKEILPQNRIVRIDVDGKPAYVLPIGNDRTVSVKGPEGKTYVEIRDKKVRITESPCPNKLCIRQSWVQSGGIICLPNRVVVTIDDHDSPKKLIDAITG